jgi:hypothetical protein
MSADEALENAIPAKIEAFAAGTEVPAYGRLFNSPGEYTQGTSKETLK